MCLERSFCFKVLLADFTHDLVLDDEFFLSLLVNFFVVSAHFLAVGLELLLVFLSSLTFLLSFCFFLSLFFFLKPRAYYVPLWFYFQCW